MWKIAWGIAAFIIAFFPQWVQPTWGLFSSEPFFPWLFRRIKMNAPKFSVNWITIPIGLTMLFVVTWQSCSTSPRPVQPAPGLTNSSPATPSTILPQQAASTTTVLVAGGAVATTNVLLKGNSANLSINIGGNNSGNIANIQNSPNANINQTTVNPKDPPSVFIQHLVSINVPTSVEGFPIAYRTVFLLHVANPTPKLHFRLSKAPTTVIGEPKTEKTFVGENYSEQGVFPMARFEFSFLTSGKVEETDFGTFSVESVP